jgi:Ubiquitin carboxyl-terminal hydrolases
MFLMKSYSTEEIRFSLLALAQRRLPVLASQLEDLTQLSTTLQSQLNTLVPDWAALETFVAAADTKVDPVIVSQALEKGDPQTILSVKKALERDFAILRANLADEEEKISEYTEYVMRRRNDYTAFIRCMLEKLAQQDLIRPILS